MQAGSAPIPQTTPGTVLDHMRAAPPLVQCITNYVAMNFAANTLLAVGASPAMVHAPEESGDFAAIAGALTVNIGTLSPAWVDGMQKAAEAATGAGKPWVLDPVAHFATPYRAGAARDLMALHPTVVRGNASEILALAGAVSAGRGVDAGDSVAAAEDGARRLAADSGSVVAVTGEVDFIAAPDGRAMRVFGGSEWMPRVTATGCALTCTVGAALAAEPDSDPFAATAAALAWFSAAGAEAATGATGPGSFAVRFLDALDTLTAQAADSVALDRA